MRGHGLSSAHQARTTSCPITLFTTEGEMKSVCPPISVDRRADGSLSWWSHSPLGRGLLWGDWQERRALGWPEKAAGAGKGRV